MYEMTKNIDRLNCLYSYGTFQSEDAIHSRTCVRCRPSYVIIQFLHHPGTATFVDVQVLSVNVGTAKGRSRETVKMLECRSVDLYCVRETRFRGKSSQLEWLAKKQPDLISCWFSGWWQVIGLRKMISLTEKR